jgi:hypothetical protein
MLSLVAALTLSGYGLYYADAGPARSWIAAVHWLIGLAAAAGLCSHVMLGKRRRAQARERHHPAGAGLRARQPIPTVRRSARSDRRHRQAS